MHRSLLHDPRHFQIATLLLLLGYGVAVLELPVAASQLCAVLATALLVQWLWTRRQPGGARFDLRSPLISGLSLCLLARSNSLVMLCVAAAIAISSKYTLRWGGKHVFNPTNFALVAMMAAGLLLPPGALTFAGGGVWVSPGQWGSVAYFGLLLAGLGGLVIHRAERSDVTYAFLGFYGGLVLLRAWWLGDPWSVALHHLQNGALLIFAFFMISDPKTTPDSRAGRILFAAVVALGAAFVHFVLFRPHGPLWALACLAPTVPILDRLLPGGRYTWRRAPKGEPVHASTSPPHRSLPPHAVPRPAA